MRRTASPPPVHGSLMHRARQFFFGSKAGDEAKDLIQRTFLLLLEKPDRVREGGNLHYYLFGIARNGLYQHYRGKRVNRDRFVPEEHSFEDLVPTASTLLVKAQEAQLLLHGIVMSIGSGLQYGGALYQL